MKTKVSIPLAIVFVSLAFSCSAVAQKKARVGKVCGDPHLPCKSRDNFQPFELPFETGKNFVIAESESFYAIVLLSAKLQEGVDCEKIFSEEKRLAVQKLFPNNKVFALKCSEPGQNYYTNLIDNTAFIAAYAGRTLAEAKKFLKTVISSKQFPGIRVRKMHAGINGT